MNDNPILQQVRGAPQQIRGQAEKLKEDVRFLLSTPEIFGVKNLIITGCGDSHMAAVGASLAFSLLAGVTAQPATAMQASRYLAPAGLPDPAKSTLAVAISNSGETARVTEAAERLRRLGAMTLAITCDPESRLGRAACKALILDRAVGRGPGVESYITTQMALYLFAIRMAEVKGIRTMDEAEALRKALCGCAGILEGKASGDGGALAGFADRCALCGEVEFIGCGPALGAAAYGAAKFLEATGMRALAQETEEFCHLNAFRANPKEIPTVLLAPAGSLARSRTDEVRQMLRVLGRPILELDAGDAPEIFAPLVLAVQLAHLAACLPGADEPGYFRGHAGVWSGEGYRSVRDSKIEN